MKINNSIFCLPTTLPMRLLSLLSVLVFTSSSALAGNEINWRDTESGLAASKSTHKMILIDLYTDWCHFCKKLDETAFTDPQLINYLNGKFVCVKVNAETNTAGRKIKKAFDISGYPCTLVFSETGTFLGKFEGCTNGPGYKIMVDRIISGPVTGSQSNLVTILNSADDASTDRLSNNANTSETTPQNNTNSSTNNTSTGLNSIKSKFNSPAKSLMNKFF